MFILARVNDRLQHLVLVLLATLLAYWILKANQFLKVIDNLHALGLEDLLD